MSAKKGAVRRKNEVFFWNGAECRGRSGWHCTPGLQPWGWNRHPQAAGGDEGAGAVHLLKAGLDDLKKLQSRRKGTIFGVGAGEILAY